jgi:hypothetical protein
MLAFSVMTIIVGWVITLTMVVRRKHCLANPYLRNPSCGGYTSSIRWSICIIIVGGTLLVLAALLATNFLQGRQPVGDRSTPDDSGSEDELMGARD